MGSAIEYLGEQLRSQAVAGFDRILLLLAEGTHAPLGDLVAGSSQ